ncbi:FadR/GntR family transcriptional regulator [Oceanobacillus jeddahense]|uniref:FadR/GntR family transcriptional regulator n=1 Tax=Oceanobacillus jeddahense TaxID=1462527 RepID=UPI000595B231|nr:FadR/GntR family transcriptional regulator [Oceanobacillus jeddahense]
MKIEYKRLYEQVIMIIKNKIDNGDFNIGEKLPSERELVKDLGVSRGTLRDAFRVLESQGIIETKPGGGRILKEPIEQQLIVGQKLVDEMKRAAILELIEAREIVEKGIIDLVCKNAKDSDLEELQQLLEKSKENTVEAEQNNDFIFHYSLAKYSNNQVLIQFMELNLNIINDARDYNFSKDNHIKAAHQEHIAILTALLNRDAEGAKKAMEDHFINIKKRMGDN